MFIFMFMFNYNQASNWKAKGKVQSARSKVQSSWRNVDDDVDHQQFSAMPRHWTLDPRPSNFDSRLSSILKPSKYDMIQLYDRGRAITGQKWPTVRCQMFDVLGLGNGDWSGPLGPGVWCSGACPLSFIVIHISPVSCLLSLMMQ